MIIFKNKHYYSFLLEFKYVEIDFDLFQEAITFKTTKSSLENCNLFYFLNIFKSYLSFFIITLLLFIRNGLIPFDFNSNKKFPTNLFLVGKKKNHTNIFQSVEKKFPTNVFRLVPPLYQFKYQLILMISFLLIYLRTQLLRMNLKVEHCEAFYAPSNDI